MSRGISREVLEVRHLAVFEKQSAILRNRAGRQLSAL
jgi:hypothetical protein